MTMLGGIRMVVTICRLAVAAIVCVVLVVAFTYLSWPVPCASRAPGLRGEAMLTPEGTLLYFNGECWTTRPMPPTDTPF